MTDTMQARDTHERVPLADVGELLPILGKISILGGLTDGQLLTVSRYLQSVSYRAGEYVFKQGDSPSHIYIVREGRVKIVADVDGTCMELVEYDVGSCFGETAAIGILPHSASALATQDAELVVLPRGALHTLYREDAELFGILVLNIAREACRRLHRTDELLLHYAAGHR